MNKTSWWTNLQNACKQYKNIAINMDEFIGIFEMDEFIGIFEDKYDKLFDPSTKGRLILGGLYGKIFGSNVFVNNNVPSGYIQFSMSNIDSYKDGRWSSPISINLQTNKFDKYLKLKVFW